MSLARTMWYILNDLSRLELFLVINAAHFFCWHGKVRCQWPNPWRITPLVSTSAFRKADLCVTTPYQMVKQWPGMHFSSTAKGTLFLFLKRKKSIPNFIFYATTFCTCTLPAELLIFTSLGRLWFPNSLQKVSWWEYLKPILPYTLPSLKVTDNWFLMHFSAFWKQTH